MWSSRVSPGSGMAESGRPSDRKLVVGVTVGASAFSLLRGQLAWFERQGWSVTLVSTPDEMAHRAAEREGVPLVGIPMHRGISPVKDLVALARWLRVLRRLRPAAVSVGTPKAALLGGLAAWLLRVPRRLYVVRGLRLEGSSGPLALILWLMEWATMRLATDVHFVGASLAAEARRRRLVVPQRSWLIGSGSSNGVDAAAVARRVSEVDRVELRDRLGFAPDDVVVGFIGRITRDKGVDTLLQACGSTELDKRARVLLIGSLEEPDLGAMISELTGRVQAVPWTDDVWGYLAAMDVLCLPTLREGFPNVVLEAGAAGIPTITTHATGAVDSVVDGHTGLLIEVGDSVALVDRINRLAVDAELRETMGTAARTRAFAEFNRERIWQGLLEIIERRATPVAARPLGDGESGGES